MHVGMSLENQLIWLLSIAAIIAILARRARLPYTTAMALTGVAVSIFGAAVVDIPTIPLTQHLIFVTFLPGLLFEAAFHLNPRELRDNIRPISILAVPGIVIAATVVTLILSVATRIPVGLALLFGVLISATDPIAVLAIFKELGVPKRLGIIVEGESLFNDGTALVLFEIVLAIVLKEEGITVVSSITQFFVVVAGGIVLGLVTGLIFAQLMRRTQDPFIDMALTMVLAYGTFLLGEEIGVSPVIAVVVAAMYVGSVASRGDFTASTRLTLASFWAYLAFLINSAIFLLIGLDLDLRLLLTHAASVVFGILAMLVARLVVIYPLGLIANLRSRRGLPLKWVHVLYWGGLRGSVSLALALSLPVDLPEGGRELLESMAFGAVFFSLIVQGLTIRPLLRVLKMTQPSDLRLQYERLRARWTIQHVAAHAVDRLHEENRFSGTVRDRLKSTFQRLTDETWAQLESLTAQHPQLLKSDVQTVQLSIAEEQKVALQDMLRHGTISDDVYYELSAEIDQRITETYSEDWQPSPASSLADLPSSEAISDEDEHEFDHHSHEH